MDEMPDCANLSTCAFFKHYEQDETKKLAIQGFITKYCKGSMQEYCVRKKVSQELGGPDKVPVNMMPNGAPLVGTTSDNWPNEVKEVLAHKIRV
jgi:hypothetical protein